MRERLKVFGVLRRGMRASIANNVTAYGFSLVATASFGALAHSHGTPGYSEIFGFVLAAVAGFTVTETLLSNFFRHELEDEPNQVIAVGAAMSFFSVGLAVGAAALTGEILETGAAWPLGAASATVVYVLMNGIEMAIGETLEEDDA